MSPPETRIPNRREEFTRVVQALDQLAAVHQFPPDAVRDIHIALDEILTNIVDYAYADDAEHEIKIEFRVLDDVLEATIEDDGVPFNPLAVPPPDLSAPLRERRVGGLGVHFVKKLMNEIRYDRVGRFNRLVLKKKLTI